jgi:Family of unknown function (DUF6152)
MRRSFWTLAVLSLPWGIFTASAHHAVQAQFDQEDVTTLTGVMTRVMWINPHVRWFMDVTDEAGTVTTWNISGAAPGAFRRIGISGREVFKTGETYTATVARARDGSNFGYVVNFVLPDGRQLDLWHQYRSEGSQ